MTKLLTSTLYCALLLVMTGCSNLKTSELGPNIFEVPVETFDTNFELLSSDKPRLKVSRISIDAPKKGDFLTSMGIRISSSYARGSAPFQGSKRSYEAIYQLEENSDKLVREFLNPVFEIDPQSENKSHITAKIQLSTDLDQNDGCLGWHIVTKIAMSINIVSMDAITTKRDYIGSADSKACTGADMFPSAKVVNKHIRNALQNTLTKVLNDPKPLGVSNL